MKASLCAREYYSCEMLHISSYKYMCLHAMFHQNVEKNTCELLIEIIYLYEVIFILIKIVKQHKW